MVASINKGLFLNAHPAMTCRTHQAAVAQAGWRNGIMPHQLLWLQAILPHFLKHNDPWTKQTLTPQHCFLISNELI